MNLEFVRKHAVRQITNYTCGPCSVRAALLCYGERVRVSRISKLAGTTPDGTDPWQCARACEELGYSFGLPPASRSAMFLNIDTRESLTDHRVARDKIRHYLDELVPVIVCVDARGHWITIIHATSKHITVADSSYYNESTPVVHTLSWSRALSRIAMWTPSRTRFDLYPVKAR